MERFIGEWKSMGFKSIRFNIILRLTLITTLLFFTVFFIANNENYLRSTYFFVFSAIAIFELFRYLDRTNRKINNFVKSLIENDFTTTFSSTEDELSKGDLFKNLNRISDKFREVGAEKEAQYLFLDLLIDHLDVGVLVFDENENISLVNESFKKLAHVKHFSTLKPVKKSNPLFYKTLIDLRNGESQLIDSSKGQKFSVTCTTFLMKGKLHKLISFQNIQSEIESSEIEAWQKLIRVLTHEIMNSVTPITSLTDTLIDISDSDPVKLEGEQLENVKKGLSAIKDRSKALETFTTAYKNLTRVPEPKIEVINSGEFLDRIKILMSSEIRNNKIEANFRSSPKSFQFKADVNQIEQVILNLIKNAIYELKKVEDPILSVQFEEEQDFVRIEVIDNGNGISDDQISRIFVPFYTTKKEGTGIGLPLSRQIVRKHNGRMLVESDTENRMTKFTILL